MSNTTPIDAWQLRRLVILADMIDAVLSGYSKAAPDIAGKTVLSFKEKLAKFRTFHSEAVYGNVEDVSTMISSWLEKLEKLEADVITNIFTNLENEANELIHTSCRKEGKKWGLVAAEKKGGASSDARKALLILNDYFVDGMPTDDNIEVMSSEARQITYALHRCFYSERFDDTMALAWLLCSSRQAWKDGFFGALGGIAHQLITAECQGDDKCMYIIALRDQ